MASNNTAQSCLLRATSSGTLQGTDHTTHWAWLGIRYGQSTAGPNRWKAPKPYYADHLHQADQFGVPCCQPAMVFSDHRLVETRYIGSEDCLFLNIWTPPQTTHTSKPLPVMVWIHGGANVVGDGNIDGGKLAASQQVIVVSVNYRLGVLGWLSHPALRHTASTTEEASGNFGTLDIIESLKWIHNNIAQFGGNPKNVTLMGLSAGGWNVFSLLHSPIAKGLFHKAIIHSGAPKSCSVHTSENLKDNSRPGHPQSSGELLLQLQISDGSAVDRYSSQQLLAEKSDQDIARYLRSQSHPQLERALDQLARQHQQITAGDTNHRTFCIKQLYRRGCPDIPRLNYQAPMLFTDGVVLSSVGFLQAVEKKNINLVPVILGTTKDESKNFQVLDPEYVRVKNGRRDIVDPVRYELANQYISQWWKAVGADEPANALADLTDVFVFRFDWDGLPENEEGENLRALYGASHGIEQSFVFGESTTPFARRELSKKDHQLSAAMMSYWSAFAYSGNPGAGRQNELPQWRAWVPGNESPNKTLLLNSIEEGGISMTEIHFSKKSITNHIKAETDLSLCAKSKLFSDMANAPIVHCELLACEPDKNRPSSEQSLAKGRYA